MAQDETTEFKIKEAAKKLFQEKGYGLTRTREIAEMAGINSALLNYYFRSKENLFHIIMFESLRDMFSFIGSILNDPKTPLSYKIETIVDRYIDICKQNPNLPLFIMNEIHSDSGKIIRESGIPKDFLIKSIAHKQIEEQLQKKNIEIIPLHFFINIISMSIMPTLSMPLIKYLYNMDGNETEAFWEDRRKWIPVWIKKTLELDVSPTAIK